MKTERNRPLSRWIDFHLSTLFYAINSKVCFRLCQRLVWIIHPHQARKPHLKHFKRACFFFYFLNWDLLSSGPVIFHPGPSHSTEWGILSVFFVNSPTALLVCYLLFRNKKEIMRLNGLLMCCFPQRCKLLFRAVFLRFDLSLVVTSQHEKIVVFQHPSVNSEDFFPSFLKASSLTKHFPKLILSGYWKTNGLSCFGKRPVTRNDKKRMSSMHLSHGRSLHCNFISAYWFTQFNSNITAFYYLLKLKKKNKLKKFLQGEEKC